ncbi:MAG: hypothetical protein QXO75_09195 [Nitrososphaerota archaeon]
MRPRVASRATMASTCLSTSALNSLPLVVIQQIMKDSTKTAMRAAAPLNRASAGPARLPYMSQMKAPETRLATTARYTSYRHERGFLPKG